MSDQFDIQVQPKTRRELYDAYLASTEWRKLRQLLFRARGRKCAVCHTSNGFIDAHHLLYRDPIESGKVEDLMVLCRACHDIVHDKMPQFHADIPAGRRFQQSRLFLRKELGLVPETGLFQKRNNPTPAIDPNRETKKQGKDRRKIERAKAKSVIKEAARIRRLAHEQGMRDCRRRNQLANNLARMANVNPMVFANHSLELLERQMALVQSARSRARS